MAVIRCLNTAASPPWHPPMKNSSAYCLRLLVVALTGHGFASAGNESHQDCCDTRGTTVSGTSNGVLGAAWANSHDIGGRLAAHRAGIRPGSTLENQQVYTPARTSDSKGGMRSAKGGPKVSDIAVPQPNKWEVFGSLFYYSEDQDGEKSACRPKKKYDKCDKYGNPCGSPLASRFTSGTTDASIEVFGGNAGVEYHLNSEWSVGAGVGGSKTRVDMGTAGKTDIDTVSVSPYISYYRTDAIGSADLWANLLYSYGSHSIDTRRYTNRGIVSGSPDADTHSIEFTVGLNFGEREFVHGPYAGLRYATGKVDAYTENGPGAASFTEQDLDSLVSILGYQLSWKLRGANGYWVPQLRAAWEHEFEDGSVSSFGLPVEDRDDDIAVVGANLSYYFDNGWNLGLEYEGRFGSNTEGHYGGVRVGKEF